MIDPEADESSGVPAAIIFFENGLAAVCNVDGDQLPQYQSGIHDDVIRSLARDGFDWRRLDVTGVPLKPEQFRDRLGRSISLSDFTRPHSQY